MVVEAAPVVPGQEDRGRPPVLAVHDRVDQPGDVGLAGADPGRRVLAVTGGRDHPAHRRQVPGAGTVHEVGGGGDVPQLVVLLHGDEVRQRVPQPGGLRPLADRVADQRRVLPAVRLRPGLHVVAPAHVLPVQQVGQVGPGVHRVLRGHPSARAGPPVRRAEADPPGSVGAGRRGAGRAARRPLRDLPQVLGQAPGPHRLEHVVLEDVAVRERPVVRDVALRVVPEYVDPGAVAARRVVRVVAVLVGEHALPQEAVHPAVVEVVHVVAEGVRPAAVDVRVVDVQVLAGEARRGRLAGHRPAVLHGDPVGAGEGAEVGVEGAVLLHDHDHVLDLVDAGHVVQRRRPGACRRGRERPAADLRVRPERGLAGGEQQQAEQQGGTALQRESRGHEGHRGGVVARGPEKRVRRGEEFA